MLYIDETIRSPKTSFIVSVGSLCIWSDFRYPQMSYYKHRKHMVFPRYGSSRSCLNYRSAQTISCTLRKNTVYHLCAYIVKCSLFAKDFKQTSHGFSPVYVLICFIRCPLSVKNLVQTLQVYGFFPL